MSIKVLVVEELTDPAVYARLLERAKEARLWADHRDAGKTAALTPRATVRSDRRPRPRRGAPAAA